MDYLITHNPQPGPVGLARSRSSWDRGHPCPQTVLVAPLLRACHGLKARAPRRELATLRSRGAGLRIVRNQDGLSTTLPEIP